MLVNNFNITDSMMKKIGINKSQFGSILLTESLGLVNQKKQKMLTYLNDENYLDKINENLSIELVITSKDLAKKIHHKSIIVLDPSYVFWSIIEIVNRKKKIIKKSIIPSSVKIGKNVSISSVGVFLGENVKIDDNVVIKSGVQIGQNSIIGPGTIIGSEGMEIKKTCFGYTSIKHDGIVKIKNSVRIGAKCTINKGFLGKDTIIESENFIDDHVHIAHCCNIGNKNIIASHTVFGGSVTVGSNTFIGLGAVIINGVHINNNATVGAAARVSRDISEGSTVFPVPSKIINLQ